MPGLNIFRIDFDSPGAIYKTGEVLTGKVIVDISKAKTIKEITLETGGEAQTAVWSGSSFSDRNRLYCTGQENYFKTWKRLVGSESENGQIALQPGRHSFNFAIPLPTNIPCSFEHSDGHVRYKVKAILNQPKKFDIKTASSFHVAAPNNLSTQQGLNPGIHDEFEQEMQSWGPLSGAISPGSIKIDVRSLANTFAPGETIELIINIDNRSQADVTDMKLKLMTVLTLRTTTPISETKTDSNVLKEVQKSGGFDKMGETSLKLVLPPQPFVSLAYCSIIDLQYQLALTINFSGIRYKIKRQYPINI